MIRVPLVAAAAGCGAFVLFLLGRWRRHRRSVAVQRAAAWLDLALEERRVSIAAFLMRWPADLGTEQARAARLVLSGALETALASGSLPRAGRTHRGSAAAERRLSLAWESALLHCEADPGLHELVAMAEAPTLAHNRVALAAALLADAHHARAALGWSERDAEVRESPPALFGSPDEAWTAMASGLAQPGKAPVLQDQVTGDSGRISP